MKCEKSVGMVTYSTRQRSYSPPSNTPRTSSTGLRSLRNGHKSVSSVSCGSLNHDETGTALLGWKIYDAGELSRMIVSVIGRPNWDRSCRGWSNAAATGQKG